MYKYVYTLYIYLQIGKDTNSEFCMKSQTH